MSPGKKPSRIEVIEFKQYGNYKPWEHGYYEYQGSYLKGGVTVYSYKHYSIGKYEMIETAFQMDCNLINRNIMKQNF